MTTTEKYSISLFVLLCTILNNPLGIVYRPMLQPTEMIAVLTIIFLIR